MKRFHVHVRVENLQASSAFYSKLFEAEPTRLEDDYAKWMLDDPRINFAISTRGGGAVDIDHLGLQADSEEELAELRARAETADSALLDAGETSCCYARSDKHWITDPQGIAWEHFRTLGDIPVYGEARAAAAAPQGPAAACCAAGARHGRPIGVAVKVGPSCCRAEASLP